MTTIEAMARRLAAVTSLAYGSVVFGGDAAALPATTTGLLNVTQEGGQSPIGTHNEGFTALRRPHFKVTARAEDALVAQALAERALTLLPGSNIPVTFGAATVFFLWIQPISDVFDLPLDGSGRSRAAVNFATLRR